MRTLWLLLLPCLVGAETVTVGPWSLDYTGSGPMALSYQGAEVCQQTTFGVYLPDWKGTQYGLPGGQVKVEQAADLATLTWTNRGAKGGQVDLTLVLIPEQATWRLQATVAQEGPCEWGFYLPIEPLASADDGLVMELGSKRFVAGPDTFNPVGASRGVTFDRPSATYRWQPQVSVGGFQIQDWRQHKEQVLRLISVSHVKPEDGPLTGEVTLTPTSYPEAEVKQRAAYMNQRTFWTDPVEVPNAGFEAGRDQWSLPGNAAMVEEDAHGGQQCAKLTVDDPAKQAVYITRLIPVVGGARYSASAFVKCAGVVKKPGKMPSCGAGLIVEWADRDGKWFAGGQYAADMYGDQDWTRQECDNLRAPEEAGFASVFLCLRGAGTAWFDDFELKRRHDAPRLEGPRPETVLDDNTPLLACGPDAAVKSFTFELSTDESFPAAQTRSFQSEDPRLAVPEPLAPGKWFWRATAPGYDPSAVWSFQQTAAADRDCAAPSLDGLLVRVTEPGQAASFVAKDERPGALQATAVLGGAALRVAAGDRLTVQPPGQWARGLNDVTVKVTDAAGNVAEGLLRVVYQPKPSQPVVIDAGGYYESAGKRLFPFGIYQVSEQGLPKVKAGGFEVVHVYTWEGSQDDVAARQYLDAAAQNGLRVFVGFDRGNSSGRGLVQGNMDHLVQRVAALSDSPGLFCWYLFDEPEIAHQYISARQLTAYADAIRALDPYHPVVVTTWGPRMGTYRRSFDTHWSQAYTTPSGIVKTLQSHRQLLGDDCPITFLAHCYDRAQREAVEDGGKADPAKFQPDAAWLRGAAYAGVTQNINGLWWWWFADTSKDPRWLTVANVPWAWDALTKVVGELHQLEPVLTAAGRGEMTAVEVEGGLVQVWRKSVGGQTTVVAVNTTENEVTVDVPVPGDGPAEVLFENRQVRRQGAVVKDSFGRYGVHVYRFEE